MNLTLLHPCLDTSESRFFRSVWANFSRVSPSVGSPHSFFTRRKSAKTFGQSASSGQIKLAVALMVGFGLHNATEGFGIVAPLAGDRQRPSWKFLLLLAVIGGGPTFLGTLIGQAWVSTGVSIAFLALAAGSILYVVLQLLTVCRTFGRATLVAWGVTLGLVLGFGTDFVLVGLGV